MVGNTKQAANGRALTRFQVYRILANNEAISALAVSLGKNRTTVMRVLQGTRTSREILAAATERALQIRANDGAA